MYHIFMVFSFIKQHRRNQFTHLKESLCSYRNLKTQLVLSVELTVKSISLLLTLQFELVSV